MAAKLLCAIFGHQVRRSHVHWDGEHYVGRCRWCRRRMVRGDDGWALRYSDG